MTKRCIEKQKRKKIQKRGIYPTSSWIFVPSNFCVRVSLQILSKFYCHFIQSYICASYGCLNLKMLLYVTCTKKKKKKNYDQTIITIQCGVFNFDFVRSILFGWLFPTVISRSIILNSFLLQEVSFWNFFDELFLERERERDRVRASLRWEK